MYRKLNWIAAFVLASLVITDTTWVRAEPVTIITTVTIASGPAAPIVAGVMVAGAVVYAFRDDIGRGLRGAWNGIKNFFGGGDDDAAAEALSRELARARAHEEAVIRANDVAADELRWRTQRFEIDGRAAVAALNELIPASDPGLQAVSGKPTDWMPLPPYFPPAQVATSEPRNFQTPASDAGAWTKLVDTARYHEAATAFVQDSTTTYRDERQALLDVATLSLQAADQRFATGDTSVGDRFIAATKALIDTAFGYERFIHLASEGSTFVAGMLEGAVGLPSQALLGFEHTHALGKAFGASLGLAADAAAVIHGAMLTLGGSGLAVATSGAMLPISTAAAAEGSAMVAGAIGSGGLHYDKLNEALNTMQSSAEAPSGGNAGAGAAPSNLRQVGDNVWESKGGLQYGHDGDYGNRVQHVLKHTTDDLGRGRHGVFDAPARVFDLIDEAWNLVKSGSPRVETTVQGERIVHLVDMHRRIGFVGGKKGAVAGNPGTNLLHLVVEDGAHVVTAYPKARP